MPSSAASALRGSLLGWAWRGIALHRRHAPDMKPAVMAIAGACRSPLGPRVTPTASATLLMPSCSFFRDALSNQMSFASARVTCMHDRGQSNARPPHSRCSKLQSRAGVPLLKIITP